MYVAASKKRLNCHWITSQGPLAIQWRRKLVRNSSGTRQELVIKAMLDPCRLWASNESISRKIAVDLSSDKLDFCHGPKLPIGMFFL